MWRIFMRGTSEEAGGLKETFDVLMFGIVGGGGREVGVGRGSGGGGGSGKKRARLLLVRKGKMDRYR